MTPRTKELRVRAQRYGLKESVADSTPLTLAVAFEAGYRAATADARKELRRNTAGMSSMTRDAVQLSRLRMFLRPLR